MAGEQAGTNPPETQSYDSEMLADARAAFEEVNKAPAATDAPAETVEVKPEPTAKVEPEKPAVAEPKADHPTDPARYADGTFKPTKADAESVKVVPEKLEPQKVNEGLAKATAIVEQVLATPTVNPPGGWSPKSKAEWEKLPEYIRADIAKREKEVNEGFAQYEGMRELRPYVDMARSQGQTLKQALDRYVGIENALRTPQALQAILHIAGNAGYSPQRLVQELAPQLGLSTGQPQGNPDQGAQQSFDPSVLQQWLSPFAQKLQTIESQFQQQSEAQRTREMTTIATVVERFKSDPAHRYYENVEPRMTQLFERGVVTRSGDYAADLTAAYDMACRLDPEISELILNDRIAKTEAARQQAEKETAEKARQASRSITGSPSSAPSKDGKDDGGDSIEDDVRRAYRAHAA